MQDIDTELATYGLTRKTYEACLEDIKNKANGINDMDWIEIVKKYNLSIHYDTLRKASQTIFGNVFVMDYFKEKNDKETHTEEGYLSELKRAKIDLEKEKQKIRDEKLEYNRYLREHSRDELICEKICDAIHNLDELELPTPIMENEQEKQAVFCFADTHYGTEFLIKGLYGETINEYSPQIFEDRMEYILAELIKVIQNQNITKLKVFSLGDELDGILRVSQLMKLKYGVVESTIKYADYISRWLTKLSEYTIVEFYTVQGNHTELRQLGQPKGTFTKDNMSMIINTFIQERMAGNPNFIMKTNESGLIFDNICGYNVLGIHGEVKNLSSAIQKFSNTYNTLIDILVAGHTHHFSAETIGRNRDVLSVPSVIGIDDYSMELGKTSNAGALVFVIQKNKGIIEQYNIKI